jgi:diaminopimelate decarboxylase
MSSNYNGRVKTAEILIDGNTIQVIRQRQSYEHLLDGVE